jgi:hypothetical protein
METVPPIYRSGEETYLNKYWWHGLFARHQWEVVRDNTVILSSGSSLHHISVDLVFRKNRRQVSIHGVLYMEYNPILTYPELDTTQPLTIEITEPDLTATLLVSLKYYREKPYGFLSKLFYRPDSTRVPYDEAQQYPSLNYTFAEFFIQYLYKHLNKLRTSGFTFNLIKMQRGDKIIYGRTDVNEKILKITGINLLPTNDGMLVITSPISPPIVLKDFNIYKKARVPENIIYRPVSPLQSFFEYTAETGGLSYEREMLMRELFSKVVYQSFSIFMPKLKYNYYVSESALSDVEYIPIISPKLPTKQSISELQRYLSALGWTGHSIIDIFNEEVTERYFRFGNTSIYEDETDIVL